MAGHEIWSRFGAASCSATRHASLSLNCSHRFRCSTQELHSRAIKIHKEVQYGLLEHRIQDTSGRGWQPQMVQACPPQSGLRSARNRLENAISEDQGRIKHQAYLRGSTRNSEVIDRRAARLAIWMWRNIYCESAMCGMATKSLQSGTKLMKEMT